MAKHAFSVRLDYAGGISGTGALSAAGFENRFSIPQTLGGAGKGTNPEELLLSAASTCYAITLSAIAARRSISLERIVVESEAFVDDVGGLRFDRIVHRAKIVTRSAFSTELQTVLMNIAVIAEQACLVSSALRGNVKVDIEPTVDFT